MRGRRLALGIAAAALIAPGAGTAAAGVGDGGAKVDVPTTVTIDGLESIFSGEVSADYGCDGFRKVKLFRKRPGKDKLVGKTSSRKSGTWSITSGQGSGGSFYVIVPPTRIVGGEFTYLCSAARSKSIR